MDVVLVVDDHRVFREVLCKHLSASRPLKIIAAANGIEALELIGQMQIDAMLLDIEMPEMNGLQLLFELKALGLKVSTVILTMHEVWTFGPYLADLGVTSVMSKNCDLSELEIVLENALKIKMPPKGDVSLNDLNSSDEASERRFSLSRRETQILSLVQKGLSNKEIAIRLNLKVVTIEGYRKALMKKVGAKSVAGLIAFAYRRGQ